MAKIKKNDELEWTPPILPPEGPDLETKPVLKKLNSAHRYLAELKGISKTVPNESILIDTLTLQEAKDSSEVENIVTTHDDLFKAEIFIGDRKKPAAKEVGNYVQALKKGFDLIRKNGVLTVNHICDIQAEVMQSESGIRKLPGTKLLNPGTGKIVYVPPQHHETIIKLLANLELYCDDDSLSDVDPLLKMAVVHFQFESIHPFYDGNGRTGRIINILYLVMKGLLDLPILYLSRYIIRNKEEYYNLLREVRETGIWENWLGYIIQGIAETSLETITKIHNMRTLIIDYKHRIRKNFPRIYSQDLINNLFRHPYTRIDFLEKDLGVARLTAAKYLKLLSEAGFLEARKQGRNNYYVNVPLVDILLGD
ncbi:Fic family protein [Fibrobacterota bacterium]